MDLDRALSDFPRVNLLDTRTPLHPLPRLSTAAGGAAISIKRDDAMALAFGGNKVRQLEYYLGDALAKGADTVLITSAVQSNFMRLTAAACAKLGLECHVQLEQRVPDPSALYLTNGNVLLDRLFGAIFHDYPEGDDEIGADMALEALAGTLCQRGRVPYIIYLGPDHTPYGALGYVRACGELVAQFKDSGHQPDRLFVASGSGHTHAGLLFGLRSLGIAIPIEGVAVRRRADLQIPRIINRCRQISELTGLENRVRDEEVVVNDVHLAPGYGRLGSGAGAALRSIAVNEGIAVDPVYTAKVLAACLDWAGATGPDQHALFIHTGGTPALFAYGEVVVGEI